MTFSRELVDSIEEGGFSLVTVTERKRLPSLDALYWSVKRFAELNDISVMPMGNDVLRHLEQVDMRNRRKGERG